MPCQKLDLDHNSELEASRAQKILRSFGVSVKVSKSKFLQSLLLDWKFLSRVFVQGSGVKGWDAHCHLIDFRHFILTKKSHFTFFTF